jgi:hypothetical protein
MKNYIILLCTFLVLNECQSQTFSPMTWYFGNGAGLYFNSNGTTSPIGGNGILNNFEGCTVLCDPYGNIIFYASGFAIYGASGKLKTLPASNSATQSPVIVQIPGSIKNPGNTVYKFLLFLVDAVESQLNKDIPNFNVCYITVTEYGTEPTFSYSVTVDNPVLVNDVRMAEKLAVCNDNQQGSWLVTHDYSYQLPKNDFYTFHITNSYFLNVNNSVDAKNMLEANTNIYTIGAYHTGQYENAQGQMKFNKNNNLLGLTIAGSHYFEIYSFDNTSGSIGDSPLFTKTIPNSLGYLYGCEFSPLSNYFYVSEGQTIGQSNYIRNIYQLSIIGGSLGTEFSIIALGDNNYEFCGLQLGPNDKIYCTHRMQGAVLSVINSPDLNGNLCDFDLDVVSLGGHSSLIGLPTFSILQRNIPEPPPLNCSFNVSNSISPIYDIQSNNGNASVQFTLNSNSFDVSSLIIDLMNFYIGVDDICRPSFTLDFNNTGTIIEPLPLIMGYFGTFSPYAEGIVVNSSHEVTWDFNNSPTQFTNQIITLNLKFPKISGLSCCKAKYFASFRVTFMDADCHSSQTILYTSNELKGNESYSPTSNTNVAGDKIGTFQYINKTSSQTNPPFSIYPNPNDGTFFIKSNLNISNYFYTIYDNNGQSLATGIINNDQQKIIIPNLTMGLYIIKINYDDNEFTTKIIVQPK